MADKKGSNKPPEGPKKSRPEDMEKTVLDVDIRNLDDLKEEFKEGFEETVMVRVPMDEDLDQTEEDFFDREETTGDHEIPELASKKKSKGSDKKEKKSAPSKKEKPAPPVEKPAAKEVETKAAPSEPVAKTSDEGSYTVMPQMPRFKPKLSLAAVAMALIFLLCLLEGLVEVMTRGAGLRLPAIALSAVGLLAFLGIIFRRWEGKSGFLWVVLAWFGLVFYSAFNYLTSDPESLHFFKMPLNVLIGPILFLLGLIVTWMLFAKKRVPMLSKILALLSLLVLGLNLTLNLLGHQTLETGLWGSSFFLKLPLLARPGILVLWLVFPLLFIASFLALVLVKPSTKGKFRGVGVPLVLLCILGSLLGVRLLARQGVLPPLLSKIFPLKYFGTTIVDPLSSAAKLEIAPGAISAKDELFHLQVVASNSRGKANARQAWLMVKNMEGNEFAADLEGMLSLSRGDKTIKSVKATLVSGRLGVAREILLLVDLPSLVKTQSKSAVIAAIVDLGRILNPRDRILIGTAGGTATLVSASRDKWEGDLGKILSPDRLDAAATMSSLLKKESSPGALRQILYLGEAGSFLTPELMQSLTADAAKAKAGFSMVSLGKAGPEDGLVYVAMDPSALGFELLSASAEALGQYTLDFPSLPPLPKINVVKSPQGPVNLVGSRFDFEVSGQDPSLIASLQIKMDDENPIDLDKAQAQQAVDLLKFKIKPGVHHLEISLTTTSGDVVTEGVDVNYVTRRSLRFVKPLDKDTISGNYGVMLSPGRVQGVNTATVDFYVDGNKQGSVTAEPMLFNMDTVGMSEGDHTLQAIQTYSDGTNETIQVQVRVNQQVPQVKIAHPSIGEYLPNLADIEAQIGGGLFEQVQKVEFLVDGEWIGESLLAPYRFLWSNNGFPAGNYFIQARAVYGSQATTTDAVQVQLGQGEVVVQADPALSPTGMLFPDNVEVLMDSSVRMNEAIGQSIKLDLAKFGLSELIQSLPQTVKLSARVYGAESFSAERNCSDSALLKNPANDIPTVEGRGTSPLAYSLKMLEQDLKKSQGSRVALLIADGWDRCGQDPLEVATQLAKQGDRIRLHVIYFSDVDPGTESLLKKLAEVMGGRTYRVRNEEEMSRAIRDAMQVSFTLYDFKNAAVINQPLSQNPFAVRSGDYRLEIDTMPSIVKEKIVIPTGTKKNFTVQSQDGKYDVLEE